MRMKKYLSADMPMSRKIKTAKLICERNRIRFDDTQKGTLAAVCRQNRIICRKRKADTVYHGSMIRMEMMRL